MNGFIFGGNVAKALRIKISQRLGAGCDPIDLVPVHHEQCSHLFRNLDSNPRQISARAREAPQFPDPFIVDFVRRAFDSHHDPFFIGA